MTTKITILTIFPEIFEGFISSSLIAKAIDKSVISIDVVNIRDYAEPPHFKVDDEIYGGGAGMLFKPEPLIAAIEAVESKESHTILMSAAGTKFNQEAANNLSKQKELVIIAGRYEGVDQRVVDLKVDQELCISDAVCMGGEVPAMFIIEAASRLLTEGIGNPDSLDEESFSIKDGENLQLEAPHYTRPPEYREAKVPEVLLSGDHQKIKAWREEQSKIRTKQNRPDLLK